jgi:hypothetical protein
MEAAQLCDCGNEVQGLRGGRFEAARMAGMALELLGGGPQQASSLRRAPPGLSAAGWGGARGPASPAAIIFSLPILARGRGRTDVARAPCHVADGGAAGLLWIQRNLEAPAFSRPPGGMLLQAAKRQKPPGGAARGILQAPVRVV